MKQNIFRMLVLVLVLVFASPLLMAQAAPTSGEQKEKRKKNRQEKKPNAAQKEKKDYLEVLLNHPDGKYIQGEDVFLEITSKRQGYLYAFYHDVAGEIIMIYPNHFENDTRIEKNQTILVPNPDSPFTLRVQPPFGKERIEVTLTSEKLPTQKELEAKVNAKLRGEEIDESLPAILDVVTLHLETFPIPTPATPREPSPTSISIEPIPTAPRRTGGIRIEQRDSVEEPRTFGLVVGIGQLNNNIFNTFNDVENATQEMRQVFQNQFKIAENQISVVYDQRATREYLHLLLTQTVPQSMRPGDTLYVYWNGITDHTKENGLVLFPFDAEPFDAKTCFTMREIRDIFQNYPHETNVVLIVESANKQPGAFMQIQSKKSDNTSTR